MMNFLKQSPYVLGLMVFGLCLAWPHLSWAVTAGNLEVIFPSSTLFGNNTNLAPGYSNTQPVTVINHSSTTETVYTAVANEWSTGLAARLGLSIEATSSGATYYNDNFATFFATAPISLGDLAAGATRTYQFTAHLATSTGNAYQGTGMGFDLVVGFTNGETVTNTPGGTGGGGGVVTGTRVTPSTPPAGRVAGASITSPSPAWGNTLRNQIAASPIGRVLGVSTTTATTTLTPLSASGHATDTIAAATAIPSPQEIFCTLSWLLFLALLSLSWSFWMDGVRRHVPLQTRLLRFSLLAHAGYIALLAGLWFTNALTLWWLPVLWWIGFNVIDYRFHHAISLMTNLSRFRHYTGGGILVALLSVFLGIPCTYWPFLILALVSALGWWGVHLYQSANPAD